MYGNITLYPINMYHYMSTKKKKGKKILVQDSPASPAPKYIIYSSVYSVCVCVCILSSFKK